MIKLLKTLLDALLSALRRSNKRHYIVPETESVHKNLTDALNEHISNTTFITMSVRRQREDKWTVHAKTNLDAYVFLHAMPVSGKAEIRHTAKRIVTSVPLTDSECNLVLTEYLYPSKSRMRAGMKDELMFASLRICAKEGTCNTLRVEFYKEHQSV